MSFEKMVEYNEIIGQLYTEKVMLEEQVADIQSEKVDMYEKQIDALDKENKQLRKQVADLSNVNDSSTEGQEDNVISLRKQLKSMTEKKDMYRNERYELQRQIEVLNRKINRLMRDEDE